MQFYVLDYEMRSPYNTTFERLEPKSQGVAPCCTACGRTIGMAPWLPPFRLAVHESGHGSTDIARGDQAGLLVSNRFCDAWETERLRGIPEFSDVESLELHSEEPPPEELMYHHIAPECDATAVDLARSSIQYFQPRICEHCKTGDVRAIDGFFIDETTWTGADIFYPRHLPEIIVISQRFRGMWEKHGLQKLHCTPVEKYVWDPLKDFAPSGQVEILGVHPILAKQPVHLVHVVTTHQFENVDWCKFTQPRFDLPNDSWQVPYDERLLESLPDGRARVVFFFHYLDIARPLLTPAGLLPLPAPTPVPAHPAPIPSPHPC